MAFVPVIVLILCGCFAVCSLVLSWMGYRIARAIAQIALLLAALVVLGGIVYDWLFVWDTVANTQSQATALDTLIEHAMNYGAAVFVPAMLAALALKRSRSNRKRK